MTRAMAAARLFFIALLKDWHVCGLRWPGILTLTFLFLHLKQPVVDLRWLRHGGITGTTDDYG